MKPTDDSDRTFCLTRSAPVTVDGTSPGTRRDWTINPPEIRAAQTSTHLGGRVDGHFTALLQPDGSAEERDEIAAEIETELEDVRPLQEEGAFLREEQGEPREIRPARIHFGLGEIGIHRKTGRDVWPQALPRVKARMRGALGWRTGGRDTVPADDRGSHSQSQADGEFRKAAQDPSAARLRDGPVRSRACPPIRFLQPLNPSL